MERVAHLPDHPKKRRRKAGNRRQICSKEPISARLVLDHQLRGDTGVLSEDLVVDLFPSFHLEDRDDGEEILHIAISPWSPHGCVEDLSWTIVPVRVQSADKAKATPIAHSTVQFPASTSSIQPFIRVLEVVDSSRNSLHVQRSIEIHVLDVVPLHLETVYVTVERHLLRNLDDIQSKFGGGFSTGTQGINGLWLKGKGRGSSADRPPKKSAKQSGPEKEERLMAAVREALSAQQILHAGDILPLPLPSHPITHVPPPPARISFCEPVSQGLLMPRTKVVLVQTRSQQCRAPKILQQSGQAFLKEVAEDEGDDTSNEQFYSAAEDKAVESGTDMESTSPPDDSDTEASIHSLSDGSDDSLDDMISLTVPDLLQQPSSTISSLIAATPRPGGKRFEVHTPGSVSSNFTSGTSCPGRNIGKTFRAEGLLARIPLQLLHPKPREDDDTDSFVFVDVHTLAKIGCFSGDWVRIEPAEEPQVNMFSSLNLRKLNGLIDQGGESGDWRAVKVYGILGLSSSKPRYSMKRLSQRQSSPSQLPPHRLTPTVLVPPLLLNNLHNPQYLKLLPLSTFSTPHGALRSGIGQLKSSSSKSPPVAKEVTLLKISTPLSMDRTLQPAVFAGLKRYFESRCRLVKSGDLVGISIDESLGKAIFSAAKAAECGGQDDDLVGQLSVSEDSPIPSHQGVRKVGVAWFRVGQVTSALPEEFEPAAENETWGGVAAIDSLTTRMVQAGSEISTVPGALGNWWEYWLGVKTIPKPSSELQIARGLVTGPPQTFVSALQRRLRELISASTSPRAIQLGMKPVVILLTSTQRKIGKSTVAHRACADIGLHTFSIDSYDILAEGGANGGDVKTEAFLKARADRAFACGPNCTALLIKHIEVLTADRMVTAMKEIVAESRVIVATTTEIEKVPEGIRSLFTHEFRMTAPEEREREGILRNAVLDQGIRISPDVDLASIAVKTAALVAGDLVDVVGRAASSRTCRLEKLAEAARSHGRGSRANVRDVLISGGDAARCVTKVDFDAAVEAARRNFADAIGAPKIPNVGWDDVGGLSNVKDAVMETIQLPLERPELFAKGMKKRSGILFYGPPGTGKTLLAKAIATEFSLNFFSVKGPELLNMYIGESEANVRRVFQRARDARPCVVFFDELDSVAPKRGNQGDSGGVMDRIVSQLLAELDGMSGGDENGGGVFVIGATNRPDLLDAALLRPGRFDKMLYLGVSDTHEKQVKILEALTRKFTMHPNISLSRIAEQLPFTYTGADLYALCSDAMLKAISRQATAVDNKIKALPHGPVSTAYFFDHLATPADVEVVVTEVDFIAAKDELVASVSAKELEHFERVRCTFESIDGSKQPQRTVTKDSTTIARSIHDTRTIGEAINGIERRTHPGGSGSATLIASNHIAHISHLSPLLHKQKLVASRGARGKLTSDKGKGKGKGKGPATINSALENGGSDSSLADDDNENDHDTENLRNGNGVRGGYPYEVGGSGKGHDRTAVGMIDGDDGDNEYIIRTDHLAKAGDAP